MQDPIDLTTLFALTSIAPPLSKSQGTSDSARAFLQQIHQRNSEALKQVIDTSGWPSAVNVGDDAEAAAFMIVQHADYDPDFQRDCHRLMLKQVARGESTRLGFLACLTDRILCNSGLHQRFGTQIREVTNGCFVPKPIEDPDQVDELREKAGLKETLADYLQRVNDGDMLLYRPLLSGYAATMEKAQPTNVLPFPKKPN